MARLAIWSQLFFLYAALFLTLKLGYKDFFFTDEMKLIWDFHWETDYTKEPTVTLLRS